MRLHWTLHWPVSYMYTYICRCDGTKVHACVHMFTQILSHQYWQNTTECNFLQNSFCYRLCSNQREYVIDNIRLYFIQYCINLMLNYLPRNKKALFTGDIFKCIFLKRNLKMSIQTSVTLVLIYNRSLSYRQWLGDKQATSHFLNQCRPSSLTFMRH